MKTILLTLEDDIYHLLNLLVNDQSYQDINELLLENFEHTLHEKIADHFSLIIFNVLTTKSHHTKFMVIDILEEINSNITNNNILIMIEEKMLNLLEKANFQFSINTQGNLSILHEILLLK